MFHLLARNAEEMKDTLAKLLETATAFYSSLLFTALAVGTKEFQQQDCRLHQSTGMEGRAGMNFADNCSSA